MANGVDWPFASRRLPGCALVGAPHGPRASGVLVTLRSRLRDPSREARVRACARELALREKARPISEEKFARYIDEVTAIWKEVEALSEEKTRAAAKRLREIAKDLADAVLEGKSIGGHNVRQLKAIVDSLVSEFERKTALDAERAVEDAWELARGPSEAAVEIMGAEPISDAEYARLSGVSRELLEVAKDFSADQIRGLADDVKRKIGGRISTAALGLTDVADTIRSIRGDLVGAEAPGRGGYIWRSETIFRTEVNRVFGMADHEFNKALAASNPGLRKMWVDMGDGRVRKAHQIAAETYDEDGAIAIEEKFRIPMVREKRKNGVVVSWDIEGYEELEYPRDPRASAGNSVLCRCYLALVDPSWFVHAARVETATSKAAGMAKEV